MIGFIHIEKTAGNTVTNILRRSYGTRHCEVRPFRRRIEGRPRVSAFDLRCSHRVYGKLQSISGHLLTTATESDDGPIWFFTFLRDPVIRCASHYQFQRNRLRRNISFERWIENPGYHNLQTRRLAGEDNVDKAIAILQERIALVGLVERFDESLEMLERACPLPGLNIEYRPRNVASDNMIKTRLLQCPRSRQMLLDANRQDAVLYRYAAENTFWQQRLRLGNVKATAERGRKREPIRAWAIRHLLYRPLARLTSGSWWY